MRVPCVTLACMKPTDTRNGTHVIVYVCLCVCHALSMIYVAVDFLIGLKNIRE